MPDVERMTREILESGLIDRTIRSGLDEGGREKLLDLTKKAGEGTYAMAKQMAAQALPAILGAVVLAKVAEYINSRGKLKTVEIVDRLTRPLAREMLRVLTPDVNAALVRYYQTGEDIDVPKIVRQNKAKIEHLVDRKAAIAYQVIRKQMREDAEASAIVEIEEKLDQYFKSLNI